MSETVQPQPEQQTSAFLTKEDLNDPSFLDDDYIDIPTIPINRQEPIQQVQQQQQPVNQTTTQVNQNVQSSGGEDDYYMRPFREFAKMNNLELDDEVAKNINKDNWVNQFVESVAGMYQTNPEDILQQYVHPSFLQAQNMLSEGKSWDEVKQYVDQDMGFRNNKESVVAWALKNQYGYDDNKIRTTLDAYKQKELLDIEYEKSAKVYDIAVKMNMEREQQARQQEYEKQQQEYVNNLRESINNGVSYFNSLNEIAGVPIGKADKDTFEKDFVHAIMPDPQTGMSPLMNELQSDETLVKVFWFLRNGDNSFKRTINQAKESAKQSATDKLFNAPAIDTGGGTSAIKDYRQETLDAFLDD